MGLLKMTMVKYFNLHKSKLNALEETLEETDGKIIIWANYLYNIHEIKDFLNCTNMVKESTVCIYGEVSVEDRKNAVDRIQNDDKLSFPCW